MKSAGQPDRSANGAREHEVTRFAISRRGVFPANRHRSLPRLSDATVTLRELTAADAPSLLEHLANPGVLAHVAPGPQSVTAFQDFIRWTRLQRAHGRRICYGIVPPGGRHPVGIIQLWPVESGFSIAEWGFAMGRGYWGTGLFMAAATLLLRFVFETMAVTRLEARAEVHNERGNGVLRKIGATREGDPPG